jgi:hypothetical protein
VIQDGSSVEARISVGRWNNTYLVPRGHPCPEDLSHRLDRCVTGRLPECCSAALAGLLQPADSSVWRIRELHLDFSVDVTLFSEDSIAKTWGDLLALQIAAILRMGDKSDSILHFENRAAYLTQFVSDLAGGRAWGKWYYEEFASLRSLTLSQAIAEALVREPGQAAAVILRLASAQRLEEVLTALTETAAGKIYHTIFLNAGTHVSADENLWIGRILALWNERPLCPVADSASRNRNALRLLVRTAARFSGAETLPAVKTVLDGLFDLREVLAALRFPVEMERIISALAEGDVLGAIELAMRAGASNPRAGLEFFSRTMAGDADWARQAAGVILSDQFQNASAAANTASAGEALLSLYGGIFLLGPSFLELGVDHIVSATGEARDEPNKAASVARQLIAVKCLGRSRANQTMSDAALRLFSGFEGADFLDAVRELGADRANLERVQSVLIGNLTAKHRCDGRCLLVEAVSLSCASGETLLIRDLLRSQWVHLADVPSGDSRMGDAVEMGLAQVARATGNEPEILFLRGGLSALADSSLLARRAARKISIDSSGALSWEAVAKEYGVEPKTLERGARPPGSELAYFSLAGLWPEVQMNAFLDLTWSLVARAALRHFAGRLPGFGSSSPEHLYQNFLSGLSTVRRRNERIEVQLPQCPLSVVLRLSRICEQVYALPWLDGSEICLLPPVE